MQKTNCDRINRAETDKEVLSCRKALFMADYVPGLFNIRMTDYTKH